MAGAHSSNKQRPVEGGALGGSPLASGVLCEGLGGLGMFVASCLSLHVSRPAVSAVCAKPETFITRHGCLYGIIENDVPAFRSNFASRYVSHD